MGTIIILGKVLLSLFLIGKGKPESLSLLLLQGFEKEFSHISKDMWKSNYNVLYPK